MTLSNAQLKKLGKRLRDETASQEDLEALDQLRRYRDPSLLETTLHLSSAIELKKFPVVIGGRAKRTKSIIRKLSRPNNYGMDLSRMGDMVGLRVITSGIAEQDNIVDTITKVFSIKDLSDDRKENKLYSRLHITIKTDTGPLEIQVRTLLQHIWANESEAFGERAKEGTLSDNIFVYLKELSDFIKKIEHEDLLLKDCIFQSNLGLNRAPLKFGYMKLSKHFNDFTSFNSPNFSLKTFLFAHDVSTNEITRMDQYVNSSRLDALRDYEALSKSLDPSRFDVLILNGFNPEGIKVTHPRLFGVL